MYVFVLDYWIIRLRLLVLRQPNNIQYYMYMLFVTCTCYLLHVHVCIYIIKLVMASFFRWPNIQYFMKLYYIGLRKTSVVAQDHFRQYILWTYIQCRNPSKVSSSSFGLYTSCIKFPNKAQHLLNDIHQSYHWSQLHIVFHTCLPDWLCLLGLPWRHISWVSFMGM